MCGIVGHLNLSPGEPIQAFAMESMLNAICYRGPDESGIFVDDQIGLGSVRLSILDLAGGRQPISNEDGTVWVVFNGEIYNYLELRARLQSAGHHFHTQSDTEVIVHLYEEGHTAWPNLLNGQFAIALWDQRKRCLTLVRDRLGVRPLYYTGVKNSLIFASEAKALFVQRLQKRIPELNVILIPSPTRSTFASLMSFLISAACRSM